MERHALSFVRGLFFGLVQPSLIHPRPRMSADERETSDMVVDTYRQFARESLDGGKFDREHAVPASVRTQLGELGILGLTIPEEHGGAGMGYTTYCRIIEETNRHCGSTAVLIGGHQSIGIKALLLHGTEEQKRTWLPKLATGEWMAAYALTEPQAGSDPASMQCTARQEADGSYVLDGQKTWITNGGFATFMTVFARTEEGKITCFVLTPAELANGFRRGAEEKKMGLRGSSTTQLFFDGCRVPAGNILGERGRGLKVAFEVLNYGRASLAAGCAGASKRILEEASKHASDRVQFGKPIAEFELIQSKLAEMAADVYATETIAYLTVGMADRGDGDFSLEAACCKVFGTEAHWRTCNHGVQIAGGIAYVEEYPYERFLRDARINMIFEGTNEILHHFIAMTGLRMPAEALGAIASEGASGPSGEDVLFAWARARAFENEEGRTFHALHAHFRDEAQALEAGAAALGRATAAVLATHGRGIEAREWIQERLAQAAMHLFVGFACLSRAEESMTSRGESAAGEVAVARHAAHRAIECARKHLTAVDTNEDALVSHVSRVASASQSGWPFSILD